MAEAAKRSILVDPACYELAHAFIEDDKRVDATEANIMDLSQDIQTAIEDWFFSREFHGGERGGDAR